MLIPLTQRQPGGTSSPVLVGSDHVIRAEPAGGGTSIMLVGGVRLDVLEPPDVLLDLQHDARDEGAQHRARDERKRLRDERQAAERKRLAEDSAARARRDADDLEAASQRHHRSALAAAEAAKRAAREAGLPEHRVTSNVTPEGVDLKHPAPQPHEPGSPAGAPHDPAASTARADDAEEGRQEGLRHEAQAKGAEAEAKKPEAASAAATTQVQPGRAFHGPAKAPEPPKHGKK